MCSFCAAAAELEVGQAERQAGVGAGEEEEEQEGEDEEGLAVESDQEALLHSYDELDKIRTKLQAQVKPMNPLSVWASVLPSLL